MISNLDEAEREYRKGLALDPAAHDVYIELGKICVEKKEDERALEEYRRALEHFPDNAMLHHEIGRIYSRKKEYLLAIDEYEKARAYSTTDGYLGIDLGFAYKEIGEHEKALKELDNIPAGCVDDRHVYLLKGENYALLGDCDRAEDELKKALQCDPLNGQAKIQLGKLHGRKAEQLKSDGKYDDAVKEYVNGISCCPAESWLHFGLGRLFVMQRNYAQAINEFNTGLMNTPVVRWDVHYELGMCYVRQQQYDKAIVEFEHATQLNPDHYQPIIELAHAYAKRGDYERLNPAVERQYDKAIAELRHTAELNPDDYRPVFELGHMYARRRDYGRATEALNEAADRMEKLRGEADSGSNIDAVTQSYLTSTSNARFHEDGRKQFINKSINDAEIYEMPDCFSRPRSLCFFLTYHCNLRCIMCERVRRKPATLPLEVFGKMKEWISHAQQIEWEGGEVFLVDYFRDLLLWMGEAYPYVTQHVTTNGLLINDEWATILAQLNTRMHFSIDSVVKDTYENIRQGGNFEHLIGNLELMHNAYLKRYVDGQYTFALNYLVMKSNADELALIPDFCKRYGIRILRFSYLGASFVPEEDIFAEGNDGEIGRLRIRISEVEARCRELGVEFKCLLPLKRSNSDGWQTPSFRAPDCDTFAKKHAYRCDSPWNRLVFHADGNVTPACECRIPIGNILSDSLENIWNGDVIKLYRKCIADGVPEKICSKHCMNKQNTEQIMENILSKE
jgi:tetratricopeptide (TPR) repeat protein